MITFRLGYATNHSETGVSAEYQWWGNLVKTCLDCGIVPALQEFREGLTTVDYITSVITYVSRNPQAIGKKFHLTPEPEDSLTLDEFLACWNNTSVSIFIVSHCQNGLPIGKKILNLPFTPYWA